MKCFRCADVRIHYQVETLCHGNIDEQGVSAIVDAIEERFLKPSRSLTISEVPVFRAMRIPTVKEAIQIFGDTVHRGIPLVVQEMAFSENEENNAIEFVLQADCEANMGYRGVAIMELISHLAYNSAYNQLRTKEQLGYIVSAHGRKSTGGSWGLSIVVQSSVATPSLLEERSENWLTIFRQELESMSLADIASEAGAVAAQYLERDTKLGQEVAGMWNEIVRSQALPGSMRSPVFDRLQRVARELIVDEEAGDLRTDVLEFFDKYFAKGASDRRAMSARVYNHKSKAEFASGRGKPGVLSSHDEVEAMKRYFSTWPLVPYWVQRGDNLGRGV